MEEVANFNTEKRKRQVAKQYQLDHIDEILLAQLVKFPSTSLRQLAALCGLSPSGVHKRTLAPGFKKSLADASGVTSQRLTALSAIALSRLEQLVRSTDDRIALSAIGLVLESVVKLRDHSVAQPKYITFKTNMTSDGRLFQDVIEGFEDELTGSYRDIPGTETEIRKDVV